MSSGCVPKTGVSRSSFGESLPRRFKRWCGPVDANGCIPWMGRLRTRGYGTIILGGKGTQQVGAHRVAWVLKNGDLPAGVLVLHHCDNPSCVNPDHLFTGTAKDNTHDMMAKGRHGWRYGKMPARKINETDCERIRDLRRMGHTQREVASWLGICQQQISLLERGRIQHAAHLFRA